MMVSSAFQLNNLTRRRLNSTKDKIKLVAITGVLLLIIFVALNIYKNILLPIEKFKKGIKLIGAGKFNKKINYEMENEFGDLSEAFNDMVESLKEITVSNDRLKEEVRKRLKVEKEIKYLSFHDQLTGLYNRRYFENEMDRLNKSRLLPISIIMADIDGLKKINDNYGHKKGDEYIVRGAEIIARFTRKEDIVARIGGDEFAVILPNTNERNVKKIAKRILNECKELNRRLDIPISISIGVETKTNTNTLDLGKVLLRADRKCIK